MKITLSGTIDLKKSPISSDTMKDVKDEKLRKACADFEAIIIQQMLRTMRKSVPKSELLETSYAEEIYQSMHDDELAKGLAHGRGVGLGELLFRQISGQVRSTIRQR